MLEQLFGSRTRTKLLRLFFTKTDGKFFVREITRLIDERINSVRRELENLEEIGLIKAEKRDNRKYYFLDKEALLFDELKELVVKSRVFIEKEYVNKFKKLPRVQFLALTGFFVDLQEETLTDILIVGDVPKSKIEKIVADMSNDFLTDIHYTMMDMKEYLYRQKMTDRFLYNILRNKKMVIVDKINKED